MELFSQRKGLKPIKSVIQSDSMDDELRNGLWDALSVCYWERVTRDYWGRKRISGDDDLHTLFQRLWHSYFKWPLDTLDDFWPETRSKIREYFFNCEWYEVYDFIEFVANYYPGDRQNEQFIRFCKSLLEREVSAYRFVGGRIIQITSEEEISEIEEALQVSVSPVQEHLNRALDLLADRRNPDYRNSIKESISAVECLCKVIANDEEATLAQALREIESKVALHPALKSAFSKLYGYTSQAEGIRHALMDETSLGSEDAKFMLASCSAFVNYLLAKASKAGVKP